MIDYTSIQTEIERIQDKVAETYDIAESKEAEIPATKNIDNLPATVASITGGSGGAYQIVVGELPDTVIELYDGVTLLDTKTISNTKINFDITTPKTYTIKAIQDSVEVWTQEIVVSEIGIYLCKSGKPLTDYTKEELSILCQNKMISTMFSLKDKWKFTQVGSIANDNDFFIEEIIEEEDFEAIRFRSVDSPSTTFAWNPSFSYLTVLDATTWANTYSNNGGYKYTDLRRQMQLMGEETWSQATSLKPDDNLDLVGGIFLSEFKYSDTGVVADIYDYDKETDTMSIASGLYTGTQANVRINVQFVKGYFKNVGTLSEVDFNNGFYYTFASNLYTTATVWNGSTTYYGFYEFLQEDGVYANAFSSLQGNLIRFDDYSSAGGTQTTFVSNTQDYFNIPSVEEITGVNIYTTLFSGLSGVSITAYNIQGEGIKKPAYDTFDIQATGRTYWTRSTPSDTYYACYIYNTGNISYTTVTTASRVRVGFLFGPAQTPSAPIFKVRNFGSMDTTVDYEEGSPQPDLTYEDIDDVRVYSNNFAELSPFKEIINGEFTDTNGNVLIQIPDIWVKTYNEEIEGVLTTTGFDLSSAPFEDAFLIPARSPAKYMGTNESGVLVSKSGVMPSFNITLDNFRTYAQANGVGYSQYEMLTFMVLNLLEVVFFGTTNSDNYFADIGGSSTINGTMDGYITAQNLTTGKNTFLGFENLIKNGYHFVDGVNISAREVYVSNDIEQYANTLNDSYESIGTVPSSNNYITGYLITEKGMLPVSNGGSSSTYFADYMYQSSDTNRALRVGSFWFSDERYGAWCWVGLSAFSYTFTGSGARLVKTP